MKKTIYKIETGYINQYGKPIKKESQEFSKRKNAKKIYNELKTTIKGNDYVALILQKRVRITSVRSVKL